MRLEEQLEAAAADLAAAAERRDFAETSACAARYADLMRQAVHELPPLEAARQMGAAGLRFEAARRKICVARAKLAQHLRTLCRSAGYRTPAEMMLHTWSVRG